MKLHAQLHLAWPNRYGGDHSEITIAGRAEVAASGTSLGQSCDCRSVNVVNSIVTGWDNFSRHLHYPTGVLTDSSGAVLVDANIVLADQLSALKSTRLRYEHRRTITAYGRAIQ